MSTYWRIYSTEPGQEGFVYVWADTAPTEIPGHPEYSFNENSISDSKHEMLQHQANPYSTQSNTTVWQRVALVHYCSCLLGPLHRVKVISNNTLDGQNHIFELYDVTNATSLLVSDTITSTIPDTVTSLDIVDNPPSDDFLLEINVKSSSSSNFVEMSKFLVYSE